MIQTVTTVPVSAEGRTFYVRARDGSGPGSEMVVHLVHVVLPGRKKVRLLHGCVCFYSKFMHECIMLLFVCLLLLLSLTPSDLFYVTGAGALPETLQETLESPSLQHIGEPGGSLSKKN